jgi:hypothetical protein
MLMWLGITRSGIPWFPRMARPNLVIIVQKRYTIRRYDVKTNLSIQEFRKQLEAGLVTDDNPDNPSSLGETYLGWNWDEGISEWCWGPFGVKRVKNKIIIGTVGSYEHFTVDGWVLHWLTGHGESTHPVCERTHPVDFPMSFYLDKATEVAFTCWVAVDLGKLSYSQLEELVIDLSKGKKTRYNLYTKKAGDYYPMPSDPLRAWALFTKTAIDMFTA